MSVRELNFTLFQKLELKTVFLHSGGEHAWLFNHEQQVHITKKTTVNILGTCNEDDMEFINHIDTYKNTEIPDGCFS